MVPPSLGTPHSRKNVETATWKSPNGFGHVLSLSIVAIYIYIIYPIYMLVILSLYLILFGSAHIVTGWRADYHATPQRLRRKLSFHCTDANSLWQPWSFSKKLGGGLPQSSSSKSSIDGFSLLNIYKPSKKSSNSSKNLETHGEIETICYWNT